MPGLLDPTSIDQFSSSLGRVVLQYSNFEAAMTDIFVAARGKDDWIENRSDKASPLNGITQRIRFLRETLVEDVNGEIRQSVETALSKAEGAIQERDTFIHGLWWIHPDGGVFTRKYAKDTPTPINRQWTPDEVDRIANDLGDAASELEACAGHLSK